MNKVKKVLIIISLFLLIQIVFIECATHTRYEYEITGIETIDYEFSKDENPNYLYEIIDQKIDTSVYYGVFLRFETELINSIETAFNLPTIINTSYAFAKSTESSIIVTALDEIHIYTINDFDSLHIAGSEVTDLFYLVNYGSLQDSFSSVFENISRMNGPMGNYLQMMIYLKSYPILNNEMKFRIEVSKIDNTVFIEETSLIIIE